jgi:hypothetical protein
MTGGPLRISFTWGLNLAAQDAVDGEGMCKSCDVRWDESVEVVRYDR